VGGKASLKGAWSSHVNHLNFGGHNHIPGTADRLRRCQLSSPVSVILLTIGGNVDHIYRRDLYSAGRVEEIVFTARRSYASAVLGVVILSIRPSVCSSVIRRLCQESKEPTGDIFIPHERAILLVKCDFSYSCAAADKFSTDSRRRAVPLR